MKIKTLLKRENFKKNLIETLSEFISNNYGFKVKFKWQSKFFVTKKCFIINENLNIIFFHNINTRHLNDLTNEYVYNKNFFKYILQSLYRFLCVSKIGRHIFNHSTLYFDNFKSDFQNWIILGGNHTIRIFDCQKKTFVVINKKNFNKELIYNTIDFRSLNSEIIKPKIIKFSNTKDWYEEDYLKSIPINRIKNSDLKKKISKKAFSILNAIYDKTQVKVKTSTYIEDLLKSINDLVESYENYYSSKSAKEIYVIVMDLINKIKPLSKNINEIPLVKSHGDFQPANILYNFDNNSTIIIDWEYVSLRSRWYDAFVFELNARSPMFLSSRLINFLNDNLLKKKILFVCKSSKLLKIKSDFFLYVFLIEELKLRIIDSLIPESNSENIGLKTFISELKYILSYNAKNQ